MVIHFKNSRVYMSIPDRVIVAVALVPIGNAVRARVEFENKVRENVEKIERLNARFNRFYDWLGI